jgi:hypothetical protein
MKLNTPLVTLLSGLALGVGVLVASAVWPSGSSSAGASSGGSGTTSPAAVATTVAVPLSSSAAAPATTAAPVTTTATTPVPATTPAAVPTTAPGTAPATAPGTAPAASATDVPPQADYVAQVNGGGAAVAVSVHGDKAVAYVCNGHAVAAWYRGKAAGGKLNLMGKNGARLTVDYRKADASGSLTADGMQFTFSAPIVHRGSSLHRQPGLYEATATVHGVKVKAGWIVLPDGGQIGSVEYFPDSAIPPTAQAPVLDLTTDTASYDGVTLVASLISGITGSGF